MFKKTWVVVGVLTASGLLLTCFQNCGGKLEAIGGAGQAASASLDDGSQLPDDSNDPLADREAAVNSLLAQIQAQAQTLFANAQVNLSSLPAAIASLSGLLAQVQNIDVSGLPPDLVQDVNDAKAYLTTAVSVLQANSVTLTNNANVTALLTQIQSQAAAIMATISSGGKPNLLTLTTAAASIGALLTQLQNVNLTGLPTATVQQRNALITQIQGYLTQISGMVF